MTLEGLALAKECRRLALDKKGVDPVILDLTELSGPSEWFLVVSGESDPQLKAIAGAIHEGIKKEHGIPPEKTDGSPASQWIVLDYGSVLVHVMHASKRGYYQLEKLWNDAPRVKA
jgi:ribosome-associated protein